MLNTYFVFSFRSCVRSLLKNTSISFLFPTILSFLIFSHNRLVYDLVVSSIVIENEEAQ